MQTTHQIVWQSATQLSTVADESIDLIVTSPPYPMIDMWDDSFSQQNSAIGIALAEQNGQLAFELMHQILDQVWAEAYRVLKTGGMVCINIGDATRTINKQFQLFSNHSRIVQACIALGLTNLPNIIWRKPTNAPNKFMGSGMLPPTAYVTLEHEFILLFRKGNKRIFTTENEKQNRRASAFFWEERNQWFSDCWQLLGTSQRLRHKGANRMRSAAYPFALVYRLINMFSVYGDTVLDPFWGTGTTTRAALATGRNSIGYEMEVSFVPHFSDLINKKYIKLFRECISRRLEAHRLFVKERKQLKGEQAFKYINTNYNFPVVTKQEQYIQFYQVQSINQKIEDQLFCTLVGKNSYKVVEAQSS